MKKFIEWSQRHPRIVVGVLVVGAVVAALQLRHLKLDASAGAFMTRKGPEFDYYLETLDRFGSDTMITVYIEDAQLFTVEKLTVMDGLVGELSDVEGVSKVESLYSVKNIKSEFGLINNSPLISWVPEYPEEADQIKADATGNPILAGNLVSQDAKKTSINLYMDPANSPEATTQATEAIAGLMQAYEDKFERLFEIGQPFIYNLLSASRNSIFWLF